MPISEMESYFKNTLFYVLKGIEVLHVGFKTKPLRKKHLIKKHLIHMP